MNEIIFELRDIDFSYLGKFPALSNINVSIGQGEKIAVIGANGSGKSTLMHLLDSLIFPDRGTFKAFGREIKEDLFNDADFSRDFRRRVGLVFQNPDVQLFCPTVKEDILFGPLQLGLDKNETKKRFDELVEILAIGSLLDRSPHQLSIGEKRKAAIASTLVIGPEVLILDEPTAGLDPATTRRIIDLLIKAHDSGKTIITSTHDLHILSEISDSICVFSPDKTIIRSGSTEAILNDEQLLKDNNLVHIHVHKHKGQVHTHLHRHLDHHH
ncbi:MAG: ABC transporter ATP-binding protein [Candidatus Omnitrophota bacterium]